MLRGVPDKLRISTSAPNERVLLARSEITTNWNARAIRKNIKIGHVSDS